MCALVSLCVPYLLRLSPLTPAAFAAAVEGRRRPTGLATRASECSDGARITATTADEKTMVPRVQRGSCCLRRDGMGWVG